MRASHSHGIVLLLVLLSAIFQIAAPEGDLARLGTILLGSLTLVAAVHSSNAREAIVRLAAAAALVVAVGSVLSLLATGAVRPAESAIINGLLVAFAPVAIIGGLVRQLRAERGVTLHTLAGVLAIYVLLGMSFSFAFGAVAELDGGRFFAELQRPSRSNELYFSYVTLSTVGYGDLTPVTDLGRTLAVTEALLGQIYLVTVVALIVGNLGARRRAG